jgi:uncharacterized membrane protein
MFPRLAWSPHRNKRGFDMVAREQVVPRSEYCHLTDGVGFRPYRLTPSFRWAGYALGVAIGGFFDGILLHQILQWHHLLSGLDGARFEDLRFQILADGLFHMTMYFVGGVGLWLLWRARHEFGARNAGRLLMANALVGFGAWHMFDGIASHWVLQIHRIRMDSDMPLVWDLLWFFVFGVAAVLGGLKLRPRHFGGGGGPRISSAPALVAAVASLSGAAALVPFGGSDDTATVMVLRPGVTPAQAMAATTSVGGRLIWTDANDTVWAVDLPDGADRMALYRAGALLISDTLLPVGCLNWFGTSTPVGAM